jgi:hypothetical protein
VTSAPRRRPTIFSIAARQSFRLTTFVSITWRRLKARSWRVMSAARIPARRISSMSARIGSSGFRSPLMRSA